MQRRNMPILDLWKSPAPNVRVLSPEKILANVAIVGICPTVCHLFLHPVIRTTYKLQKLIKSKKATVFQSSELYSRLKF